MKPVLTGRRIVLMMFLVMIIIISLSFSVFAVINPSGQTGAAPIGTIFCQNEQRCKEIDEVWSSKISYKVGGGGAGMVWDFSIGGWKTFAEMYPSAAAAAPTYTSPPDTTFGLGEGGTSSGGVGACYQQAISSSNQLAEQNLKTINFQGTPVRVHKFTAPLFEKVNQEITQAHLTYQFSSVGTWSWRCVKSPKINIVNQNTCMGSDGKVHRSKHSYGTAIDINPATNPFCSFNKFGNLIPDQDCKSAKLYDLPQEVINIFKNNDFDWGGDWEGAKDYMHFVWKGNKGDFNGDGILEQCPSSTAATGSATVSAGESTYDSLFIKYCEPLGISPAWVKAISKKESGISPSIIGPAGEIGFMQFNSAATSFFSKLTKCCVYSAEEKKSKNSYSCSEEHNSYGKTWGVGKGNNPYLCTPDNDDRFNPDLNIKAGCEVIKRNYDKLDQEFNFASTEDLMKVTIASHHFGLGGIKSCIKGNKLNPNWENSKCKADLSGQILTWEMFTDNLASATYKGKGKTYKEAITKYVTQISDYYIIYNAQLQPKQFFSSS